MLINLDNKVICLKDVSDKKFHLRDVRDDNDVIDITKRIDNINTFNTRAILTIRNNSEFSITIRRYIYFIYLDIKIIYIKEIKINNVI